MRISLFSFILSFLLWGAVGYAEDSTPGEFSIPAVVPLRADQIERMRHLIEVEPGAAALGGEARGAAVDLLGEEPEPLEEIHYEGLVNTEPARIATVEKLRKMGDAARLVRYWQVSGDEAAAATLRSWIEAWANTYRPTGNDVNENKLYPLFVAYFYLRPTFDLDRREEIDAWLKTMGKLHAKAVRKTKAVTNRYTKHLKLLAIMSEILDREDWREAVAGGVKRFVTASLREDGTSADLELRDTLTYHASALRPLIELAMLAGDDGPGLYAWKSPKGGSIETSVNYIVPFAMGERTREEWVNTKVDLDRRRAAEGLEAYQAGRRYDPQSALSVMEEASFFDPKLLAVVGHLRGETVGRFASWQMLVNETARPLATSATDER